VDGNHGIARSPSNAPTLAAVAATAGLFAALIAIPFLALSDKPLWYAPAIPICAGAAMLFVWNTRHGLYFIAFAIAPLGIVQYEIAGITVNLPEVLILALFAKEALRFAIHKERPVDFFPKWSLPAFALASVLGILTGLLRGNYFVGVLQDFRQYSEYILLYLLILHRVNGRRQIVLTLFFFMLGMMLIAVHGILQHYFGWGISAHQMLSDTVYHSGIRGGSFYGATPLGALMVLTLGTAAGLGLSVRSRIAKAFILACAITALTAAILTYTRASWIAIAVEMVFIFFSIRKTPLLAVTAVVVMLVLSVTMGSIVVQRMEKIEISKRERSLLERLEYYTAAWHIFRAHPLLGLGWGCCFNVNEINLNGRYVPLPPLLHRTHEIVSDDSSVSARYLETYRAVMAQSTVHSAYLQILVRTGLVGIVPFLWFLGQWIGRLLSERRHAKRVERDHNLYIGVAAGIVGYLTHALVENFFQWPVMAQSFWLLLALTTIMAAQLSRNESLDPAKELPASPQGDVP